MRTPISRTLVLYDSGIVGTPFPDPQMPDWSQAAIPPSIIMPASISSDGTPQVGEELVGIDPQVVGTITRRRWFAAGTLLFAGQRYTPLVADTLQWIVDVLGANGQTIQSSSTIVVLADPTVPPTLANTLADANIPIGSIPGLLARLMALDARLVALGLAAADPDVAEAIGAALLEYGATIEAIDLHRPLSVVLPEFEAAMTRLEEAANPDPEPQPGNYVSWRTSDTSIRTSQTNWRTNGLKLAPGSVTVPDYAVSSVTSPVEGTGPSVQLPDYAVASVTSPVEGSGGNALPDYAVSSVTSPQEGTGSVALPDYAVTGVTSPQEGGGVPNYEIASVTSPQEGN